MEDRLVGGARESREQRKEEVGELRWEETLEVKVTEVNRKGEELQLPNVWPGAPIAGSKADTSSEALWVILSGNA